MQVLDPECFATAQYSTCIMKLEDIFHSYGKISGTGLQYLQEALFALLGNKAFQVV
jgi:hypothetical protein